jgi:GTPase SAR1 family protein
MYNIAIIGPPAVGKTCWIKKILFHIYENNYIKTFDATPYTMTYQNINFNCIDIPSYKTESYINQANIDGLFIMCEMLENHLSLVKQWKSLLKPNIKLVLIINKLDIDQDNNIDLELFCHDNHIDAFTAITIKDEFNIMEPFDKMAQLLLNNNIIQIDLPMMIQMIDLLNKSKDMDDFKIKYLEFIYKNNNTKLKNIILTLNDIIIKHDHLSHFLNYLINAYKYT